MAPLRLPVKAEKNPLDHMYVRHFLKRDSGGITADKYFARQFCPLLPTLP